MCGSNCVEGTYTMLGWLLNSSAAMSNFINLTLITIRMKYTRYIDQLQQSTIK